MNAVSWHAFIFFWTHDHFDIILKTPLKRVQQEYFEHKIWGRLFTMLVWKEHWLVQRELQLRLRQKLSSCRPLMLAALWQINDWSSQCFLYTSSVYSHMLCSIAVCSFLESDWHGSWPLSERKVCCEVRICIELVTQNTSSYYSPLLLFLWSHICSDGNISQSRNLDVLVQ